MCTWLTILALSAVLGTPPESAPATQPAPPQRIVALAPSSVELIWALGAGPRLIGVGSFVTYPPEAAKLPKVGGIRDPDLEQILTLRPDLVVLRGRTPALDRLCQKHGIRVWDDQTQTLDDIFGTIEALGRVLGTERQAGDLARELHSRLDKLRKPAGQAESTAVLLTVRSPDRLAAFTTAAGGSHLDDLLRLVGGRNVFADLNMPYPEVALEEALVRRPQCIVEFMPGQNVDDRRIQQILEQWRSAGFGDLVERKRVHVLTEDYALIPSPRVVLLAEKLHKLVNPEPQSGD